MKKILLPTLPYSWMLTAIVVPIGAIVIADMVSSVDFVYKIILALAISVIILVAGLISMSLSFIKTELKLQMLEHRINEIDAMYEKKNVNKNAN